MSQKKWIRRKPETMLDWIIVACAAIAFYMVLYNASYMMGLLQGGMSILAPFAGGVVIAYAINPIVDWLMDHVFRKHPKLYWLAMLIGYLVALALVIGLIYLIVTQAITSINAFYSSLPSYTENLKTIVTALQNRFPELQPHMATVLEYLDDLSKVLGDLIRMALNSGTQIMSYFGDVTNTFVQVFTAIASSIYLLSQKDKLLRHARILTRAFLPRNVAENTLRICHKANKNLTGFFTGKIIDSAIIGVLTFVVMTICRLSYAPLISIIVGVTNIIPVFGPFIGAIPGILILLFLDPWQALWFLIIIILIQQLDGNFIGPTILGDSIGISALWVLFSIVVGGDLFGLVGMVIGVPVFATLYGLIKELAQWCLRQRGIDYEGRPLKPKTEGTSSDEGTAAAEGASPAEDAAPADAPKPRPGIKLPGKLRSKK